MSFLNATFQFSMPFFKTVFHVAFIAVVQPPFLSPFFTVFQKNLVFNFVFQLPFSMLYFNTIFQGYFLRPFSMHFFDTVFQRYFSIPFFRAVLQHLYQHCF
jgi:hypothetical protein